MYTVQTLMRGVLRHRDNCIGDPNIMQWIWGVQVENAKRNNPLQTCISYPKHTRD